MSRVRGTRFGAVHDLGVGGVGGWEMGAEGEDEC